MIWVLMLFCRAADDGGVAAVVVKREKVVSHLIFRSHHDVQRISGVEFLKSRTSF